MKRSVKALHGGGSICRYVLPALMSALLIISITSCNGTSNPLVSSIEDVVTRNPQSFDTPSSWGSYGYSLDSCSTTWVSTIHPDLVGDLYVGDLTEEEDPEFDEYVDTRVTAFVRHTNTTAETEIEFIMIDADGDTVYTDTFSAGAGPGDAFCRHPAVEVTYRWDDNEEEEILQVHIVWAEFTEGIIIDDNWDLYYKTFSYTVDYDEEIDWDSPDWDPSIVKLPFCTQHDEIQPDIGMLPNTNDLYVIYVYDPSTGYDRIKSARHESAEMDDPDDWDSTYEVSTSTRSVKWEPCIDGGLFTYQDSAMHILGSVVAVWCEVIPADYAQSQIFYRDWGSGVTSPSSTVIQLTFDGEMQNESSILPTLDITPRSSGVNEAVMGWSMAEWDQEEEEFINYAVKVTTTPFFTIYGIPSNRYSRCPDIACLQMDDADEHWFGISYYYTDDLEEDWEVWIRSISFRPNYESSYTEYEGKYVTYMSSSYNGYWNSANPFTGSTLCLRDPYVASEQYQVFGLGWIDLGFAPYLTEGTIN